MSMTANPTTTGQATFANFVIPSKTITHLGRYIEPTTGKQVWLSFDQGAHAVNVDAVTAGALAPASILFRSYAQLRPSFYGKNLIHLGAFANDKGTGDAWYDPANNIIYIDTTT